MTRDEAKCVIKYMLDDAEKYGDIDYWDLSDFISACKVAIKALSDVPDTNVGKWIPVSERLPDIKEHHVSDTCIVYCKNEVYGFAELQENLFGQVGWDCERDDEYHEQLGEVIAWMPLPEPYTEEQPELKEDE